MVAQGVSAQKLGATGERVRPALPATHHTWAVQLDLGDPGRVAVRLPELLPELRIAGMGLRYSSTQSSPVSRHLRFQQSWRGYPIEGTQVTVNADLSGRVLSVISALVAEPLPTAVPAVSPQALATISPELWTTERVDTVWVKQQGQYVLALGADVQSHTGRAERWLIHGTEHTLLSQQDRRSYMADTSVRAFVFRPDPLTTAGVDYGATANYRNNSGATNAALDAQRRLVRLRGVTWTGSQFQLSGPNVRVLDFLAPTSAVATGATDDFRFDRSQSGFTDAMAYFYIDSVQRYVQAFGYTNLNVAQGIRIDARGDLDDQSYFVGGSNPYIAMGIGGVPDAEDADVLVHEYAHALSYWAAPGTNSGFERQGFDEGFGDYLAASFSLGFSSYRSEYVFNWDGHNEFWPGRLANDATLYPASVGSFYQIGSLWCGTMMQARALLGQSIVDRVQLQALYLSSAGMSLAIAAQNIMTADALLYGTVNQNTWRSVFCARGLLTGGQCVSTPVEPPITTGFGPGVRGALDAWIVAGGQQLTMVNTGQHAAQWQLCSLLGSTLQRGTLVGEVQRVDLTGLSAGVYLVRLSTSAEERWVRVVLSR
jgi:hypothetical protein